MNNFENPMQCNTIHILYLGSLLLFFLLLLQRYSIGPSAWHILRERVQWQRWREEERRGE